MAAPPRIRRRLAQCRLEDAAGDGGAPLHPLLRRIFENRDVRRRRELEYGLENLHAPGLLKGIDAAVDILHRALAAGRKILVVGDYDVDGATASALALLALRAFGAAQVDYLVPNRFRHGYGLSAAIADIALQRRPAAEVVITVDNGIASLDGVAKLRAAGVEVVVTDHHLPGAELPAASAIVNPNQPGCGFPSKALAGVGVMFYVLLALRAKLRVAGWFGDGDGGLSRHPRSPLSGGGDGGLSRHPRSPLSGGGDGDGGGRPMPNLADFLDLVALGTVADIVPLDHNNRILVAQGVRRIQSGRCRPGIRALAQVAGKTCAELDARALGFVIGPRLNAAGRMDDMSAGIECLLADDAGDALRLAGELHAFNARRHQVQKTMQLQAEALVEKLENGDGHSHSDGGDGDSHSGGDGGAAGGQGGRAGLCLFDADWHQGITGLVASRVKDKFHRPVVAFAPADDGQLRGSARSIAGLHIRDCLAAIDAAEPGFIAKFGGHAMAAGLSIDARHLDAFAARFDAQVAAHFGGQMPDGEILTDGELAAAEFTVETAEMLRDASPWGAQFPPPLFDGDFRVLEQRVVGDAHLKMKLALVDGDAGLSRHPRSLLSGGGDGDGDNTVAFDAIAFRCIEPGEDAPALQRVEAVYQLSVDEFRGRRRLQLVVEHLRPR